MVEEACKQAAAVGGSQHRLDVVFGVRHHPEHIAALVENTCDGIGRPVEIPGRVKRTVGGGISEKHPALSFKPLDGGAIGDIVALAMRSANLRSQRCQSG